MFAVMKTVVWLVISRLTPFVAFWHWFEGVAVSLLCVCIAWELWRLGASRARGKPVDLGRIWRGNAYALAGILIGPWLALEALNFGNALVQALVVVIQAPQVNTVFMVMRSAVVILMILIWVQTLFRAVELLIAAFIAPIAALGYVLSDDGAAGLWWRPTAALVADQVAQVTVTYVAMYLLWDAGFPLWVRLGGCIAALVVAMRAPHVVQPYMYHSGAGGATTPVQ